jgi:hypothetical protein
MRAKLHETGQGAKHFAGKHVDGMHETCAFGRFPGPKKE